MYQFVTVYLLWLSVILCVAGLLFQIIRQVIRIKKVDDPVIRGTVIGVQEHPISGKVVSGFMKSDPFLFVTSFIFHILLIFVPFFIFAHAEMFFMSWQIRIPSLPERISDFLTLVFIASSAILFLRRLVIPGIRQLSNSSDYFYLLVVIFPFLTGFLAFHGTEPYRVLIYLHVISAEILMVMTGWTRLGHMIYFMFKRLFHNEFLY